MLCCFSLTLSFFPFISNLLVHMALSKLSYKISSCSRVPRCLQPGSSAVFSAPLARGCKPLVHPIRPYLCGAISPNIHLIQYLFHCPFFFCSFELQIARGLTRSVCILPVAVLITGFGVVWGFFHSSKFSPVAGSAENLKKFKISSAKDQSCHQSRPLMPYPRAKWSVLISRID